MYLIDSIAKLIGEQIKDAQIPFELVQDSVQTNYYESKNHGLQILAQNGVIVSIFFFLGKSISDGNEMIPRPWYTTLGLKKGSSQADVRSMYGEPIVHSRKIQKGYSGGYTGWWDKFHAPWGVIHITYSSDLNSITLVVCGKNES